LASVIPSASVDDSARVPSPSSGPTDRVRTLATLGGLVVVAYAALTVIWPPAFGWAVFGIILTPPRIALLTATILILPAALTQIRTSAWARIPPVTIAAWVLFLGAALASVILHPSAEALARWFAIALEGTFVYLLVRMVVIEQHRRNQIVLALIASTVAVSLVALALIFGGVQYQEFLGGIFGWDPVSGPDRHRFGIIRIEGSPGQPLIFGTWLAAAIALAMPIRLRTSGAMWRLAATLIIGLALTLTASRSAILVALFLPAAYFGAMGLYRRMAIAAVLAIPAAVLLLSATGTIATVVGNLGPHPGNSTEIEQSTTLRLEAYLATLRAVGAEPWFGHGLLSGAAVISAIAGTFNAVDSSYLQTAVEMGVIGLVAMLALLVLVATQSSIRRVAEGPGAFLAFSVLLLLAAVSSLFSFMQGWTLLWMVAAIATSPSVAGAAQDPVRRSSEKLVVGT
jgi:hypothetical protein